MLNTERSSSKSKNKRPRTKKFPNTLKLIKIFKKIRMQRKKSANMSMLISKFKLKRRSKLRSLNIEKFS